VNDEIVTVSEVEDEGMMKAEMVGGDVSPGAGRLEASPGKVPAWISAIFENVSLSESWLSIAVKLPALL
jgi:hypothetical protein